MDYISNKKGLNSEIYNDLHMTSVLFDQTKLFNLQIILLKIFFRF